MFLRLAILVGFFCMTPMGARELYLGEDAPEFQLFDQEGYPHTLKEHKGHYVLLFFYPRDFMAHSIQEVKAFEKAYQALKEKRVAIYGISNDFREAHVKFHKQFNLTYDLLSDPNEETIRSYHARSLFGRKFITYLIGPDGRIFRKYSGSAPTTHPQLVLQDLSL